ncbi:MAG: GerW family sporulation protein [Clostridia bacterium]|nr:GerW family sporulation protein [Clostridia bacterium]
MAEHPINGLMETAMQSIKDMVDVNTIVGEPVESKDGTIIIPISKVSFGFGAGGSDFGQKTVANSDSNFGGGSGGGATIEPVAFMVVGKEEIKLMPIEKNTSPAQDIIDSVPTLIDKVVKVFKKKKDKSSDVVSEEVATVETL